MQEIRNFIYFCHNKSELDITTCKTKSGRADNLYVVCWMPYLFPVRTNFTFFLQNSEHLSQMKKKQNKNTKMKRSLKELRVRF